MKIKRKCISIHASELEFIRASCSWTKKKDIYVKFGGKHKHKTSKSEQVGCYIGSKHFLIKLCDLSSIRKGSRENCSVMSMCIAFMCKCTQTHNREKQTIIIPVVYLIVTGIKLPLAEILHCQLD